MTKRVLARALMAVMISLTGCATIDAPGDGMSASASAARPATALKASIQHAPAARQLSPDNRAHLRESIATIDDALRANLTRVGA